jgi:hypothetical protein
MKHGDKNAKSVKPASHASGEKSSAKQTGPHKAGKGVETSSSKKGNGSSKAAAPLQKSGSPAAIAKESSAKAGSGSGKESSGAKAGKAAAGKGSGEAPGFNNPVIGDAFRRAVQKYPNAFRKLTD